LHRLTGIERSPTANRHLAGFLAFVAGATNAGGFLAVHQYTSHMSGIVSAMADDLATGGLHAALRGAAAVLAFLLGAILTTLLIRWGRARSLESTDTLPLLLEACLLIRFGLTGKVFVAGPAATSILHTVLLLCFTMGLQNAMITKISNAVIRTTHLTGMLTDIGIALGRMLDHALTRNPEPIASEFGNLRLHTVLVTLFFLGGITGAIGFHRVGFLFTLPLAALLLLLSAIPAIVDLKRIA
jgi:uncharacterized membrane protein YoaK (UPF0700 family)